MLLCITETEKGSGKTNLYKASRSDAAEDAATQ